MARTLAVAVLGATGLVGEHVLTALARSDLPIGRVQAFGSANRAPSVDTVAYGGESIGVRPITHLAELDAEIAILCLPRGVAPRIAAELVGRVPLVIDAGGAAGGELALLHPAVAEGFPTEAAGAVRLPGAVATVLGALVAPLREVGLKSVSGTVLASASHYGRGAVDELGQQVVARLNHQDPPRRLFPSGLAFDVLPEDTPGDEWSATEEQAAAELGALAGLPPAAVALQVGTAPLFAGLVASVHLRGVTVPAVEERWRAAALAKEVVRVERLRPRAVTGRPEVAWGRLRAAPANDGVFAWIVGDPVALAATFAVESLRRALAAGRLPEDDA